MADKLPFVGALLRYMWKTQNMSLHLHKYMLPFFVGTWKFERKIESLKDGSIIGEVTNADASFCEFPSKCGGSNRDEQTLLYREKGQLKSDNFCSDFTRQYFYEFEKTGHIKVFHCSPVKARDRKVVDPSCFDFTSDSFEKGAPFHELKFENDVKTGLFKSKLCSHICGQDIYEGHFEVRNEPEQFESFWNVNGPQKCYCIKTWYRR